MARLAFLGCGAMGKQILDGLLATMADGSNTSFTSFIISVATDKSMQALKSEYANCGDQVTVIHGQNAEAAANADIVILGFPPNQAQAALGESGLLDVLKAKLVISLLAGVAQPTLYEYLGAEHTEVYIVRTLPSIGMNALASATLVVDDEIAVPQDKKAVVYEMFDLLGTTISVNHKTYTEATGFQGLCVALMTVAIDSIIDSGVSNGVPRDQAQKYAGAIFQGYGKLLARGDSPAEMKNSLLIPYGLTVNAMLSLEKGGVRAAIADSMRNTIEYTKTMARKG